MNSYIDNIISQRPKDLCKKCGRCCRVATNNKYTYNQLKNMASDGNEYAQDFIKVFEPYPSIEAARAVDAEIVDNIIKNLKEQNLYDENDITFYGCRYITDNNLCSIYEERPIMCSLCPANGWVVIPPNCGYESWGFMKREEDMRKVRRAKEELIDLEVMKKKTQNEELSKKIEAVEKKLGKTIDMFSEYGSHSW